MTKATNLYKRTSVDSARLKIVLAYIYLLQIYVVTTYLSEDSNIL